jgi:hypothetical protein
MFSSVAHDSEIHRVSNQSLALHQQWRISESPH